MNIPISIVFFEKNTCSDGKSDKVGEGGGWEGVKTKTIWHRTLESWALIQTTCRGESITISSLSQNDGEIKTQCKTQIQMLLEFWGAS